MVRSLDHEEKFGGQLKTMLIVAESPTTCEWALVLSRLAISKRPSIFLHNKVLLGYPQSITCATANAMEEPPWKKIRLSLERPYKNDDGEPIPVLLDITAEGTHIYEPYVDFEG